MIKVTVLKDTENGHREKKVKTRTFTVLWLRLKI